MNTLPAKVSLGLAVLLTTAGTPVGGQDEATARATVEFRLVVTPWTLETFAGPTVSSVVAEGETTTQYLQMKLVSPTGDSPCTTSTTMGDPADLGQRVEPSGPLPLWRVEATVRRAKMDDIEVAYHWTREVATRAGTETAEGRGEATLTEKGRVLLDYVPTSDVADGCLRSVGLELATSIPEDPAFAERGIAYDLWLVHEDGGKRANRRLQLIGRQGEDVAFDYGPFRMQLRDVPLPIRTLQTPAGPVTLPTSDILEMTVGGRVRGRLQDDGSIELFLGAGRTAHPSDGRWGTSAHGEKRVRATPGETLRLELPPPAPIVGVNEPEVFAAIAKQSVALILTPTLVE